MFASLFGPRKVATPLLDLCRKANERTLQGYVETASPSDPEKKATVLWMLKLMGAANLADGLKWEKAAAWPSSKRHWQETNMDTVAAEGLMFLDCYFARRFLRAAATDRPTFERIGHDAMQRSAMMAVGTISSAMGADYSEQAIAARSVYAPLMKDGGDLVGPLTARILACTGRRSLAEPPRASDHIPDLVAVPLSMHAAAWFASMPSAYWDTLAAVLREMPERFNGEDDD